MVEFLERLVIIFVSVFVASGTSIAHLLTEQKRVPLFLRIAFSLSILGVVGGTLLFWSLSSMG
jgi:hypothetical protein